jgi:hypothetical protein
MRGHNKGPVAMLSGRAVVSRAACGCLPGRVPPLLFHDPSRRSHASARSRPRDGPRDSTDESGASCCPGECASPRALRVGGAPRGNWHQRCLTPSSISMRIVFRSRLFSISPTTRKRSSTGTLTSCHSRRSRRGCERRSRRSRVALRDVRRVPGSEGCGVRRSNNRVRKTRRPQPHPTTRHVTICDA